MHPFRMHNTNIHPFCMHDTNIFLSVHYLASPNFTTTSPFEEHTLIMHTILHRSQVGLQHSGNILAS